MRNTDRPSSPRKDSGKKPFSKPSSNSSESRPSRPRKATSSSNEQRPFSEKRSFSNDKPRFERNERPFGERPFGDKKPFGEKRSFSNDKPRFERNERPFGEKRNFSSDKPRFEKSDRPFGEKKPFGEKRSFSSDKPRFEKSDLPFGNKKPFGEKRSFSSDKPRFEKPDRPFGERPFGDKKPFGEKRNFSSDKPSLDKPRFEKSDRPFGERPFGDKKPFGEKRSFSSDKPGFEKPERPFGERPFGDKKPFGEKRDFSNEKPRFEKPDRPFGERQFGDKKPFGEKKSFSSDKPYLDKPRFEKPARKGRFETKENQATISRKEAPNLDFERIKEKLPQKIQRKIYAKEKDENEDIRLNRYIANAGVSSRRDADELIASGQITVNGKEITEMGYKVKPNDVVKYGKKILNREKMVYLLLNKPKDFITTTEDPEARNTVMDLVASACEERIYPVGRLDRNTTGLLLMTNDGELAEKLSHPSNLTKKVYQVELNKPLTNEDFEALKAGFELEDGFIKVDDLAIITPDAEVVGVEIHSGRNRIVRRMFEHLGYEVMKLDRTTYAGLTKKDLPRSKWRFLTEKEIIRLKYMI